MLADTDDVLVGVCPASRQEEHVAGRQQWLFDDHDVHVSAGNTQTIPSRRCLPAEQALCVRDQQCRLPLCRDEVVVRDLGVVVGLAEPPLADFIDLGAVCEADDLRTSVPTVAMLGEVVDAVLEVLGVDSRRTTSEVVRVVAVEADALVFRRDPSIPISQRVDVIGHRVDDRLACPVVEQRLHSLAEHQSLVGLNCLGVDRIDLLARSVTQELPRVAQPQVVVLVGVRKLVVADVRVLPSWDTELSRNLKLEIANLRDQFDIRQDRIGQDSNEALLVLVVDRVGLYELLPQLVDVDTVNCMGEDITFGHIARTITITAPDSELCYHLCPSVLIGGWGYSPAAAGIGFTLTIKRSGSTVWPTNVEPEAQVALMTPAASL